MNKSEKIFLRDTCIYCIKNYSILNSSPIISSLIYQICKMSNIDCMPVRGIVKIRINQNITRTFAHCFNVGDGIIIDASIYEYAIMHKQISDSIPFYVVENIPCSIEYIVESELPRNHQFNFPDTFLKNIIKNIKSAKKLSLYKFNMIDDSKKSNLFFCRQNFNT